MQRSDSAVSLNTMCATEMLKAISMKKKKKKSVHVEEKDSDGSASNGSGSDGSSSSDESSSDESDGSESPRAQRRKAHKLLQEKKTAAEYQQAILDDILDRNQSSSSVDVSQRSQVANLCSSLVGFVFE